MRQHFFTTIGTIFVSKPSARLNDLFELFYGYYTLLATHVYMTLSIHSRLSLATHDGYSTLVTILHSLTLSGVIHSRIVN